VVCGGKLFRALAAAAGYTQSLRVDCLSLCVCCFYVVTDV